MRTGTMSPENAALSRELAILQRELELARILDARRARRVLAVRVQRSSLRRIVVATVRGFAQRDGGEA